MTAGKRQRRILLTITEHGPVQRIWQALRKVLTDVDDSEIVALFVADDRWQRAASLPFTHEVLLISGATRDFTPQRARDVADDAARQARAQLESLAAEAGFRFRFEIVQTSDEAQLERMVTGAEDTVIVTAELAGTAAHATFQRLSCNIVLIEETNKPNPP